MEGVEEAPIPGQPEDKVQDKEQSVADEAVTKQPTGGASNATEAQNSKQRRGLDIKNLVGHFQLIHNYPLLFNNWKILC